VLAPLADMIGNVPANRQMPRFGVENAVRVRRDAGAAYPAIDEGYFFTLFRRLNQIGLLPPVGAPFLQAAK
jgi:hypothetical protein